MNRNTIKLLAPFIIIFFVFIGAYFWLLGTEYLVILQTVAQDNLLLVLVLLFVLKTLSIVWPPLPGGLFTLGSIPFIGWEKAYIVDFMGSTTGSAATYYLGRRYGMSLVKKLFSDDIVQKIKKIKVRDNRQIELVLVLRVFTGSVFMEAITYGAGLLRLRFSSFMIGSVVSHLVVGVPIYYFAQRALVSTQNIVLSVVLLAGVFIVLYKAKGRYFE